MAKVQNILPFIPMVMNPVKAWMYSAHDEGEHTLCWSDTGKRWMLENPKQGFIRYHYSLINGLSDLERVSGNCVNCFTIHNLYTEAFVKG